MLMIEYVKTYKCFFYLVHINMMSAGKLWNLANLLKADLI